MVRYYASRRTSMTIQLLATLSFAAGFSGTLLLPIDLSLNIHHGNYSSGNNNADANADANANADNNNGNDDDGEIGYYEGTLVPWHILFWSTSTLAWVILPIVKEMLLSGNFTLYHKFKEGVRKRLRFVFIVLFVSRCDHYLLDILMELIVQMYRKRKRLMNKSKRYFSSH